MENNVEELVGTEVGVLSKDGNEVKKIIIKRVANTSKGMVVFDEDDNIYFEDELNFSYVLTPECILYYAIEENGIPLPEWDDKKWKDILHDFMRDMVKSGYITKESNYEVV